MSKYTDDQLRKYAADVVAGLKNANFTPEDVAGVMAWGLGMIFLDSANGLTKEQYMANVVVTVGKCIESRGEKPRIIRPV
jgi:hypothetical protein